MLEALSHDLGEQLGLLLVGLALLYAYRRSDPRRAIPRRRRRALRRGVRRDRRFARRNRIGR